MADCFAADVDDLHRRWLPREIFADIGIPDAAPPSAAAAVVEDVAVHLTAVLGGKKEAPPAPPPPQAPALQHHHHHHYHQAAQVGGLQVQGAVLVAYGYGAVVPAPWPFLPYPPLQWQVTTTNFGNGGGFPGHAPSRTVHHGPPPAKRRLGGSGGTGVFLPRAGQVHQYQHKAANRSRSPPAKDGKPPKEWRQQLLQRDGDEDEAATQQQNSSAAELALPQDWTY